MRLKEIIGLIVMSVWIALGVWAMNQFGFQNHPHDLLWSFGAALALIILIVSGVAIFFMIAKETPWIWFTSRD